MAFQSILEKQRNLSKGFEKDFVIEMEIPINILIPNKEIICKKYLRGKGVVSM